MASKPDWQPFPINKPISFMFYEDKITTLLTSDEVYVEQWIQKTYQFVGDKFLVGLDTEFRWDNDTKKHEVAVLQLCVGRRCLVYQLSLEMVPQSLVNFLGDENLTFVGKEVLGDVELLARRGLNVACAMDVAHMAAKKYDDGDYKSMGLKNLASTFLDKEMEKDKSTTMSNWQNKRLTWRQVEYASIDALVSLELGQRLLTPCSAKERAKRIAKTKEACMNAFAPKKPSRKNMKKYIIEESTKKLLARINDFSDIVATGWDD